MPDPGVECWGRCWWVVPWLSFCTFLSPLSACRGNVEYTSATPNRCRHVLGLFRLQRGAISSVQQRLESVRRSTLVLELYHRFVPPKRLRAIAYFPNMGFPRIARLYTRPALLLGSRNIPADFCHASSGKLTSPTVAEGGTNQSIAMLLSYNPFLPYLQHALREVFHCLPDT
jgi:hypothetical protein